MARIRYFIEYVLEEKEGTPSYKPIGVWAHDLDSNEIDQEFLPGYDEEEFEAAYPLNQMAENDTHPAPDFLDYWQQQISPYRGMRGEILETNDYKTSGELTKTKVRDIIQHHEGNAS